MNLLPAYEREYNSPEAVLKDWLEGKDFQIEDSEKYLNIHTVDHFGLYDRVFHVRYGNNERVALSFKDRVWHATKEG